MNAKHTFRYMLALLTCGFAILSGMSIRSILAEPTNWNNNYTALISSNGSGTTQDNPILISTPAQLAGLAARVNLNTSSSAPYRSYYYRLTASIDLGEHNWTPIGFINAFSGSFDGGNFVIKNMKINPTSDNAGLFGYTLNATIQNVKVEGMIKSTSNINNVGGIVGKGIATTIKGVSSAVNINTPNSNYVGGVAGMMKSDTTARANISLTYNTENIVGLKSVGGIVGYINGNVQNAFNTATITGNNGVGGIAGYFIYKNVSQSISNCYNLGNIFANSAAGGIVGNFTQDTVATDVYSSKKHILQSDTYWFAYMNVNIYSCYNIGDVTTTSSTAGGIVGHMYAGHEDMRSAIDISSGIIVDIPDQYQVENSYNTGKISGTSSVGGIAGYSQYASMFNVSNSGEVRGTLNVSGIVGGVSWSGVVAKAYNSANVTGTGDYVGGIVGGTIGHAEIESVRVEDSANTGTISGVNSVGGIFGYGCSIYSSYNAGSIVATGDKVGGLLGESGVGKNFIIKNSYNQGTITGKNNRGGLIGYIEKFNSDYLVQNCYNVGTVTKNESKTYVGSLIGRNYKDRAKVTNCYYLNNTSIPNKGLGNGDNTGTDYSKTYNRTASQLRESTFAASLSSAFQTSSGNYPKLTSVKDTQTTVALPDTIWEIKPNVNNGHPVLIEFYW